MPDTNDTVETDADSTDTAADSGEPVTGTDQATDLTQDSQRVTRGESVTDIFSRVDTKPMLIQIIGIFGALGIGYSIFGYFAVNSIVETGVAGDSIGALGGALTSFFIVIMAALVGPVVSVTTSIRANGMLAHVKDDLAYATGAVGASLGQLVLIVLTIFFATAPLPSDMEVAFGDFTTLIFLSVVVTGVVAAISMYVLRSLADPDTPA